MAEGKSQLVTRTTTKGIGSAGRERLAIEAAAAMFPENGIEGTKMTDVADAAGVGVASLYRYFGTKVNLALAAGTLLWRRFNEAFTAGLSPDFPSKTGYEQLHELFGVCVRLYRGHPRLLAFLDELDHQVLSTSPDPGRLSAYDAEVMGFYPLFLDSYERGVADGTVRTDVDFPLYYRTASHALASIGQKLIRGEVVPSDDFSEGWLEQQMAVEVFVRFLQPTTYS